MKYEAKEMKGAKQKKHEKKETKKQEINSVYALTKKDQEEM